MRDGGQRHTPDRVPAPARQGSLIRAAGSHRPRRQGDARPGDGQPQAVPDSLMPLLQEHLQPVKALHEQDLAQGYGAVRFTCPIPRRANTPTPTRSGAGNTSSPPAPCPKTAAPLSHAVTTCTRAACRRQSERQRAWRASSNRSAPTPCAIVSRLTSWKPMATIAPSRSSWATAHA